MTKGLPNWFRVLFTVVMLTLCCVLAAHLIHQKNTLLQISELEGKIETAQKRLAKQLAEFEEYVRELPQVEAELAAVAPEAEAAAARVDELKAQRKSLRAETEATAAILSDLLAQAEAGNTDFLADSQNITQYIDEASLSLESLEGLFGD